jgi:hypothetical protein
MPSIDPPSSVPVCTTEDEINAAKHDARQGQRPFVAVTDEEGMSGWRARYSMSEAGHDRESWYLLREEAVAELETLHREFQQYADQYSFNDGCSHKSGALHGLSEEDARELAGLFAEVVWDVDNWREYSSQEVFMAP